MCFHKLVFQNCKYSCAHLADLVWVLWCEIGWSNWEGHQTFWWTWRYWWCFSSSVSLNGGTRETYLLSRCHWDIYFNLRFEIILMLSTYIHVLWSLTMKYVSVNTHACMTFSFPQNFGCFNLNVHVFQSEKSPNPCLLAVFQSYRRWGFGLNEYYYKVMQQYHYQGIYDGAIMCHGVPKICRFKLQPIRTPGDFTD